MQTRFASSRDYLDTHEMHGLLGTRGLYGYSIQLEPREHARLTEVGAELILCPASNMFIGSSLFDLAARVKDGIPVGLSTDTKGGSSFSILRTMAAAYDIAQLCGIALHPPHLFWMATNGSARALHASNKIGRISMGMEAELIAIDLSSTPAIAQRKKHACDLWEAVFRPS